MWTAAPQSSKTPAGQAAFLRILKKPNPARPEPRRSMVEGSGMGSGTFAVTMIDVTLSPPAIVTVREWPVEFRSVPLPDSSQSHCGT